MLTVQSVVRRGGKTSRVVLSDGRVVKLPNTILDSGVHIEPSELVEVEINYKHDIFHASLVQKKRERTKVEGSIPEDFNAAEQLALIRSITYKYLREYGMNWTEERLDDWCMDTFAQFWEKDYYKRYQSAKLNYASYLSVGIRNRFIDFFRSSTHKNDKKTMSLNVKMNSDADDEFIDTISDTKVDIEKDFCFNDLLNDMREFLLTLDTGLQGVSYVDIFDALRFGDTSGIKNIASSAGYSISTVMKRKSLMVEELQDQFYQHQRQYLELVG